MSSADVPALPLHEAFGRAGRFEEALKRGTVVCGEGYLFEMERRGYVQIGPFVPTVVVDEPAAVTQLHREFLRAGSDVIEAFTYYGHRSKLRLIGKEDLLEELNLKALRLAQEVALERVKLFAAPADGESKEGDSAASSACLPLGEPALVAGNVCNTTTFVHGSDESAAETRAMFTEQVGWAKAAGVDLVVAETFDYMSEAMIALEVIKAHELPSVITMACHTSTTTRDGIPMADCLAQLEEAGATVVGLNCARGPATMLPVLREVREKVKGHLAALPVCYRTTAEQPTFQSLTDDVTKKYTDLDPHVCTRYDLEDFTKAAAEIGVQYMGVCCGGAPHHVRAMSQALGRSPPSAAFSHDLSKHFAFGTKEGLGKETLEDNLKFREVMG